MQQKHPSVTVIVPAYNASRTIRQTLDSLLAQRDVEFEIIVSDNHSTDNTADIVRSYNDNRVSLVTCPVPPPDIVAASLCGSLSAINHFNTLLDYGRGEFMCFYHADDIYDPEILAKETAFLTRHSQASAVFAMGRIINEQGITVWNPPQRFPKPIRHIELFNLPTLFEATLLYGSLIWTPTFMVRRSVLKKVGGWRVAFEQASDYELWFRLAREAPIGIIQECLFSRRVSTHHDSYRGRSIYRHRPFPIFNVYDYFLTNTDVVQKITPVSLQALNVSRSIDLLRVARNCFVDGRIAEAKKIILRALVKGTPESFNRRGRIFIWAGWLLWGCAQLGLGRMMARLQNKLLRLYDRWKMRAPMVSDNRV